MATRSSATKLKPEPVRIVCERCGAVMEPSEHAVWEYDRAAGWGRHDSESGCIQSLGDRLKRSDENIRRLFDLFGVPK